MSRMTVRSVFFYLVLSVALVQLPADLRAGEDVVAEGDFVGQSQHTASGTVKVVRADDGAIVVFDDNFRFDGAPDPKLGFGKDGYVKSTKFSALKSNAGGQVYEIPASIDPEKYNEVWIWCETYNVPLGVAELQ